MEGKKCVVPGEVCAERFERGKRGRKAAPNVQKSAEAIVAVRRRAESVGAPSTIGKRKNGKMTENLGKQGYPQKDSAEHESYAGAYRPLHPIKEKRSSAQRKTDTSQL